MKRINKYILSAMLLGCGTMVTTSCNDYLTEKPESMIGPDNVGDSKEAVDTWVTGVYSNWLYDMFCWGEFPKVLELDADYISGPDWLFVPWVPVTSRESRLWTRCGKVLII